MFRSAYRAPFLIATMTEVTMSQRLGISAIALFLVTGMILMFPVRSPQRKHKL